MNSHDDSHTYLVMWDCYGLEAIFDVTAHEYEKVISILSGDDVTNMPLRQMLLRATLNPQRNYEIYTFDSEMPVEKISTMFHSEAEAMISAIRRVGNPVFTNDNKE